MSLSENNSAQAFAVKDCALVSIATGKKAINLSEMLNILRVVQDGSIYYHFWGALLRPRFGEPEYNNDFATWAYFGLRDMNLAERLAVIDPSATVDLEDLRQRLIEVIEQRLDEVERLSWRPSDRPFHFMRSQLVIFDTHTRLEHPESLVELIPRMSQGTIFYHFIDAQRRAAEGLDDFRMWLQGFGDTYTDLIARLALVDPYFTTLPELRDRLVGVFGDYFAAAPSRSLFTIV